MRRTSILVGNYINQGSMNALKWVSLKKVEILQSSEWTYAISMSYELMSFLFFVLLKILFYPFKELVLHVVLL